MSQTIGNDVEGRTDRCECKLGTVMATYSIEGVDEDIVDRWVGDGSDHMSLRELAEYFNLQVLRAAIRESDLQFVDEEIRTIYTLLTDNDVSGQTREQVRSQLEAGSIDLDSLTDDFVSYQTVNRHLKKCHEVKREAETETDDQYVRRRVQKIYALENKLDAVTNDILDQLDTTGRISLSDFETDVDVQVRCSNCGAHHNVVDIVENQGCLCESTDTT